MNSSLRAASQVSLNTWNLQIQETAWNSSIGDDSSAARVSSARAQPYTCMPKNIFGCFNVRVDKISCVEFSRVALTHKNILTLKFYTQKNSTQKFPKLWYLMLSLSVFVQIHHPDHHVEDKHVNSTRSLTSNPPGFAATGTIGAPPNLVFCRTLPILLLTWNTQWNYF